MKNVGTENLQLYEYKASDSAFPVNVRCLPRNLQLLCKLINGLRCHNKRRDDVMLVCFCVSMVCCLSYYHKIIKLLC